MKKDRKMADQMDEVEKVSPEYEAHHNLIGLFSVLLEVDRRVNPHLYEKKRK